MKRKDSLIDIIRDLFAGEEDNCEDLMCYQYRKIRRLYDYLVDNTSQINLIEYGENFIKISVDFFKEVDRINFLYRLDEQQYNDDISVEIIDKESMTLLITTSEKEVLLSEN